MHDIVQDTRKRLFPNCVLKVYSSFAVYTLFPLSFTARQQQRLDRFVEFDFEEK
jgi:hypothetical protein